MTEMTDTPNSPIREAEAMLASMAPELQDGSFVFCSTSDPSASSTCDQLAIAKFVEAEGDSFILPLSEADRLGFDCSLPMRMITLTVNSALDGFGLTAAVSSELAALGISCNMVAAYYHDYIFVPNDCGERALEALMDLQQHFKGLPAQR